MTRRWMLASTIGVTAAALQFLVLFRTLGLANRAWPEASALAPAGIAFYAFVNVAMSWGFCFFWAGLAAVVIRRGMPHSTPWPNVFADAMLAHVPAVIGYLAAASRFGSAEREWARAGDTVTFEAIGAILDVGPIGDALPTLAVVAVFGVLIRVRYRELTVRRLALALVPSAIVLIPHFVLLTLRSPLAV